MRKVSIIIPTYNKIERLRLTISSYIGQTYKKEDFEIIIVADSSDTGIYQAIEHYKDRLNIKVIQTEEKGMPRVRNIGAQAAEGQYLGFFDDDVLVSPDYLEQCMLQMGDRKDAVVRGPVYTLYFLRFFKDPEKGVVFPQFENQVSQDSPLREYLVSEEMVINHWDRIGKWCTKLNRFERIVEACLKEKDGKQVLPWMGYSGSGVIIHKDSFFSAGGYDVELGKWWGAESIDLGYRLWKAGKVFINTTHVYTAHMDHPRDESLAKFNDSFSYVYNKYADNNILLIKELIRSNEKISEALKRVE
jgi:glycosyltransferase involved in cell wall biosynthesis